MSVNIKNFIMQESCLYNFLATINSKNIIHNTLIEIFRDKIDFDENRIEIKLCELEEYFGRDKEIFYYFKNFFFEEKIPKIVKVFYDGFLIDIVKIFEYLNYCNLGMVLVKDSIYSDNLFDEKLQKLSYYAKLEGLENPEKYDEAYNEDYDKWDELEQEWTMIYRRILKIENDKVLNDNVFSEFCQVFGAFMNFKN